MDAVVLIPYRDAGCWHRNRNFEFVKRWWSTHHPDFPMFVGDSVGSFSRSAARNRAARDAGDWDVAVFADADTIAHPEAVEQAVYKAAHCDQLVVAADSHMYACRESSERIHQSGVPMFARPDSFDEHGVYARPCSGILAVNRDLFDRVGGYVESLTGWGYEDLVFLQLCGIFGGGNTWVDHHITIHLWHPKDPRTADTTTNKLVWDNLARFRRRADRDGARRYLADLGHRVL